MLSRDRCGFVAQILDEIQQVRSTITSNKNTIADLMMQIAPKLQECQQRIAVAERIISESGQLITQLQGASCDFDHLRASLDPEGLISSAAGFRGVSCDIKVCNFFGGGNALVLIARYDLEMKIQRKYELLSDLQSSSFPNFFLGDDEVICGRWLVSYESERVSLYPYLCDPSRFVFLYGIALPADDDGSFLLEGNEFSVKHGMDKDLFVLELREHERTAWLKTSRPCTVYAAPFLRGVVQGLEMFSFKVGADSSFPCLPSFAVQVVPKPVGVYPWLACRFPIAT